VQPCLVELYETKRARGYASPPDEDECITLLHDLVSVHLHTTFVLDGLDGVDEATRTRILEVLFSLVAASTNTVKLLYSRRRAAEEVGPHCTITPVAEIEVGEADVAGDIGAVVAAEVDAYDERNGTAVAEDLRDEIVDLIKGRSRGS
jgi:hypothetical protein